MSIRLAWLPIFAMTVAARALGGGLEQTTTAGTAASDFQPGITKWQVPGRLITPDFSAENPARRVRFLDDGLALEVSLDFVMIKHKQINIVAELPEDGQFKVVQANPHALVELKSLPVQGGRGRAELVAKVTALSPSDVTAQARKIVEKSWDPVQRKQQAEARGKSRLQLYHYVENALGREALGELLTLGVLNVPEKNRAKVREKIIFDQYVFDRTLRELVPEIRDGLNDLARRKPGWVPQTEQTRWKTAPGRELLDTYTELLECEVMDAHLSQCGLGLDTGVINFKTRTANWFDAVYVVTSGKAEDDPAAARRILKTLIPKDVQRLRDALSVHLRCRFYPEVDPQDPNAQWLGAQRLACLATGASSIRVEGRLDPARHDRVDWWIVEGYSPAKVNFHVEKKAGFRVDPPFIYEGGARLRVVATGEGPVDYAMEFRPARTPRSDVEVLIYESPAVAGTKFPF